MTARTSAALAHANIAFSKYWGKRPYDGNYPATPSLSMTVSALTTRTRVTFDDRLAADRLVLGGEIIAGKPLARVSSLLDRLRAASGERASAEIVTANDFPTAAGLASSAAGFAALALAGVRALGLGWELDRVSDLARQSSASAARSVYGGFVELPAGGEAPTSALLAARPVAPTDHVDWRLVVAVCGEGAKSVGSSAGMDETRRVSPYYDAWLALAPSLHARLLAALAKRDLDDFGALAERSALSMHASALAAGVVYLRGVTIDALSALRDLRTRGVSVFATMDAGPHVKALCGAADAPVVAASLRAVPGVTRVVEARPAEGARVIDPKELG